MKCVSVTCQCDMLSICACVIICFISCVILSARSLTAQERTETISQLKESLLVKSEKKDEYFLNSEFLGSVGRSRLRNENYEYIGHSLEAEVDYVAQLYEIERNGQTQYLVCVFRKNFSAYIEAINVYNYEWVLIYLELTERNNYDPDPILDSFKEHEVSEYGEYSALSYTDGFSNFVDQLKKPDQYSNLRKYVGLYVPNIGLSEYRFSRNKSYYIISDISVRSESQEEMKIDIVAERKEQETGSAYWEIIDVNKDNYTERELSNERESESEDDRVIAMLNKINSQLVEIEVVTEGLQSTVSSIEDIVTHRQSITDPPPYTNLNFNNRHARSKSIGLAFIPIVGPGLSYTIAGERRKGNIYLALGGMATASLLASIKWLDSGTGWTSKELWGGIAGGGLVMLSGVAIADHWWNNPQDMYAYNVSRTNRSNSQWRAINQRSNAFLTLTLEL